MILKKFIKPIVIDSLAAIFAITRLSSLQRRSDEYLLIITFHRILPDNLRRRYPYPGLVATPEELEWILLALGKYFHITTASEAIKICRGTGNGPVLGLTFDDGQLDNYLYAKPVLDKLQIKGTFYIPVNNVVANDLIWHDKIGFALLDLSKKSDVLPRALDLIRDKYKIVIHHELENSTEALINAVVEQSKQLTTLQRNDLVNELGELAEVEIAQWAQLMSWQQIRELHQEGHEIGSHSMTHALIDQLDDDQLTYELNESKKIIETELATEIESFCYPNGNFDDRSLAALEKAGYSNAVTTQWGQNEPPMNDFTLKRCDMDARRFYNSVNRLSAQRLAMQLAGLHPGLR